VVVLTALPPATTAPTPPTPPTTTLVAPAITVVPTPTLHAAARLD